MLILWAIWKIWNQKLYNIDPKSQAAVARAKIHLWSKCSAKMGYTNFIPFCFNFFCHLYCTSYSLLLVIFFLNCWSFKKQKENRQVIYILREDDVTGTKD